MSKHQEILDYLEKLAVGKRVSVRSISNHLKVSDGTAYRAIKEAENRGLVETRPRSGTVRIEQKSKAKLEKLTYQEIAQVSDSQVVAGQSGLGHEFSKFSIGAMTLDNIGKYLVKGGLLIVGDRENIQLLALQNHNAILITGGFEASDKVKETADELGIPVMVTNYDTFTVATMINQALSNVRIKTDIKTVDQVYHFKSDYGYLTDGQTVKDYNNLIKKNKHIRYPVVNKHNMVVGVVSMRDVAGKSEDITLDKLMTKNPTLTKPTDSLANIGQRMIYEDFDMLPVVAADQTLLGVITRRQVMEGMEDARHAKLHTYSDQIITRIKEGYQGYEFRVEPAMIDSAGNLAHGVLTEVIRELTLCTLTRKSKKNIIIDQMVLYFLQAVQIDDVLIFKPRVIAENRRHSSLDFEIYSQNTLVVKAFVTTRVN
ncbi:CBS-HotDog domain-containing transcription factor SpxR [Streptococcus caprae]|uniref:CBS-HotDog domain-containing transcription factor SpxR n=1 Tax=Streptococcus caprae TaxID=1640501 RepID=A0ABV8CTG0_9STRE